MESLSQVKMLRQRYETESREEKKRAKARLHLFMSERKRESLSNTLQQVETFKV